MRSLLISALTAALLVTPAIHDAQAGDPKARPAKSKAGAIAQRQKAAKTGNLTGKIYFRGQAPARDVLNRSTDPACSNTKVLSEDLVVTNGLVRDVLVSLPNGIAHTQPAPDAPVVISQNDCTYAPRVVGIMSTQKLAVDNGDPTYHNVRGNLAKKVLWNLGQPAKAARIVRENLGKPGDVISLHCDVHPWMRAFAVVTDHPFFVVTGSDGSYTINDIPAGTYELKAWHPVLREVTTKLTVKPGVTMKVDLHFTAANLPRR